MTVVDKYLKELVQNNRRVIIPDLGAFLLKESGSDKVVIFSSFLRYNDGFLEDAIVEKAKIDKTEASAVIRRFVEGINKQTKNKKRYQINGFGYFSLDEKGVIQFICTDEIEDVEANNNDETIIVESAPVIPPSTQQPTDSVSNVNTDNTISSILKEEEPVKNNTEQEQQHSVKNSAAINEPTQPINTNQSVGNSSALPPVYIKESKKRSRLLWLIILLLFIIVALLAMLYLCATNSDLCFFRKKSIETEQYKISTPITHTNNADSVKMLVSPSADAVQGVNYYVVARCFSEQINAERFKQHLYEQGYVWAEILPKIGELYPVSINKSPDFKGADEMRVEYNNKHDGDAWLFRSY